MFDGDSFYKKEFKAWIETEPKGAKLRLHCSDMDNVMQRVNSYCRNHGHTVETHKVTETILTLKLIWI